jgi:hypothetical protein
MEAVPITNRDKNSYIISYIGIVIISIKLNSFYSNE